MTKQVKKVKSVKAWAVRHMGFWLVCPNFAIADITAKHRNTKVVQVLITEVK